MNLKLVAGLITLGIVALVTILILGVIFWPIIPIIFMIILIVGLIGSGVAMIYEFVYRVLKGSKCNSKT